MQEFYSKIVGVTYDNRQYYISCLKEGDQLKLSREPDNIYDVNAIAVYDSKGNQLGHIRRDLAATIAPMIDNGESAFATVEEITGGDGYNYGANIKIYVGKRGIYDMNGDIAPAHLNDMMQYSYMNCLDEWGMFQPGISDGITVRRMTAEFANLNKKYNAALQILGGNMDAKSVSMMTDFMMFIGDFENALYLFNRCCNGNILGISKDTFQDAVNFLDTIGVGRSLELLKNSTLTKNDFSTRRSNEDERELYPEVYAYDEFKSNYTNVQDIVDDLQEMINSPSLKERILGNAFSAELEIQSGLFNNAMWHYIDAAILSHNNPVYYGYAGNAMYKLMTHDEKAKKVDIAVFASILTRRAINLDFLNARWHFYEALILESLSAIVLAIDPNIIWWIKWFNGAGDEYELALSLTKDYQKGLRNAIITCMNRHKEFESQIPDDFKI